MLFSLADVTIETGAGEPLRVPGFDGALPDGVLLRYHRGRHLRGHDDAPRRAPRPGLGRLRGVWNSPSAIARSVRQGGDVPAHRPCRAADAADLGRLDPRAAAAVVTREARPGDPLVLKPLSARRARARAHRAAEDLPEEEAVSRVYYLQRYVPRRDGLWRDYRVFVCDGRAIAGMIREGDGWITNVHRGAGRCPGPCPRRRPSSPRRGGGVGVAYSGVDLVEDGEGGYAVLEVNFHAGWSGLQTGLRDRYRGQRGPRFPRRRQNRDAPRASSSPDMLPPGRIADLYRAACASPSWTR